MFLFGIYNICLMDFMSYIFSFKSFLIYDRFVQSMS